MAKTSIGSSVQISQFSIHDVLITDTSVHGGLDQATNLYGAEDYADWHRQLHHPAPCIRRSEQRMFNCVIGEQQVARTVSMAVVRL